MLAELTEVRKQYGNFQLNCTMQLEEGRDHRTDRQKRCRKEYRV